MRLYYYIEGPHAGKVIERKDLVSSDKWKQLTGCETLFLTGLDHVRDRILKPGTWTITNVETDGYIVYEGGLLFRSTCFFVIKEAV